MTKLEEFINLITGEFDNTEQLKSLNNSIKDFPLAQHINTVCNEKIENLPIEFDGIFIVEESYYTINGKKKNSPHLFLFTQHKEDIILTSYDIPKEYSQKDFTYKNINKIDFNALKQSKKFNPCVFKYKDGVFEGKSESMFTDTMKFTLHEKFSKDELQVSESIFVNGKRTFGYDIPIIYKRK